MITKEQLISARNEIREAERLILDYAFQEADETKRKIASLKRGDVIKYQAENELYFGHGLVRGKDYVVSGEVKWKRKSSSIDLNNLRINVKVGSSYKTISGTNVKINNESIPK